LQTAAVLAVGSRAGWLASEAATRQRDDLPVLLRRRIRLLREPLRDDFDAAIVEPDAAQIRAWSRSLAEREGAIVSLHVIDGDAAVSAASFPLERLMVERSVSVNTAAAGGNASLMTVG
jgi:RHH-type proline utilization regulon transcriptional repressor/proline dehydrogenase/delta 1-pyrroline-5-carboxylate dehydrogenase